MTVDTIENLLSLLVAHPPPPPGHTLSREQQALVKHVQTQRSAAAPIPGRTRHQSWGSTGSGGSGKSSPLSASPPLHELVSLTLPSLLSPTCTSPSLDRLAASPDNHHKNVNPTRYKTEMCRPFEESGHCKYGDKCQFAHGEYELRNLSRHPKYKTELCRTFHTVGFCPYGPRCHFVHNEDELKLTQINHMKHQHMLCQVAQQVAQQQQALSRMALPEACKPLGPMPPRFSQLFARPQSLDCGLVSLIPGAMELRSVSLPMSVSLDSPPASVADSSSPSLSPMSTLSDDVFGVPTPPPGFSALPAPVVRPTAPPRPAGVFDGRTASLPLASMPPATRHGARDATLPQLGCMAAPRRVTDDGLRCTTPARDEQAPCSLASPSTSPSRLPIFSRLAIQ